VLVLIEHLFQDVRRQIGVNCTRLNSRLMAALRSPAASGPAPAHLAAANAAGEQRNQNGPPLILPNDHLCQPGGFLQPAFGPKLKLGGQLPRANVPSHGLNAWKVKANYWHFGPGRIYPKYHHMPSHTPNN
jgi:hypothetical protein